MSNRDYAMSHTCGHCAPYAAACASARACLILDTAVLAVSIIIVRLVSLLVLKV